MEQNTPANNKISITRALVERKSLDDRIAKASILPFVTTAKGIGSRKAVSAFPGKSEEDVKKILQGNFDSVKGLIDRRNQITKLIILSNATTKVNIGNVEMTVAEAIERKKSIALERALISNVISQRSQSMTNIAIAERQIETRIEAQCNNLISGKEKKAIQEEDLKTIRESVENYEKLTMVEFKDMSEWASAELENIVKFESEVDVILTESNSKTEIDLTPKTEEKSLEQLQAELAQATLEFVA